jgi:methylated-DNA-[protein]-cysteine S-methyltransferase
MKYYTYYESPLKQLLLVSDGLALTGLYFQAQRYGEEIQPDWQQVDSALPFPQVREQLAAYFAGVLQTFDIPLALPGSAFQRLVWEKLQGIPFGKTISYSELAWQINRPTSIRAVGGANARNPISIIVPCHRVIGAHGSLTGYGGGLEVKSALLSFEASVIAAGARSIGLRAITVRKPHPGVEPLAPDCSPIEKVLENLC